MPGYVVFNFQIAIRDMFTGVDHDPEDFDAWFRRIAKDFGGASVIGEDLMGLWYDSDLPAEKNPVEDQNNWYKIAVEENRIQDLRKHVENATQEFGQKNIYLEETGKSELIRNPTLPPAATP